MCINKWVSTQESKNIVNLAIKKGLKTFSCGKCFECLKIKRNYLNTLYIFFIRNLKSFQFSYINQVEKKIALV